ncbi:MAG: type I glyceraldehyde-3-phosphate dehydrogenase, partial [Eggerthellaceae bacterium]|nr:type I glyceraldehyde-3-phosphate dehydrogenase [Eggerthellaceae bacterium]
DIEVQKKNLSHLLKYDSIHGILPEEVKVTSKGFELVPSGLKGAATAIHDGTREVKTLNEGDPVNIPWGQLGVDIVIESTGLFTDANKAKAHIDAGAKKVIVTAPTKNEDITIVMGVNEELYDPEKHNIVSNASCTTNCLAPVAKIFLKEFGIKRGYMNTIHSYTNDQVILDRAHKDLRRARAAALSMIPTTTGAARAVSLVLPELAGKLDGFATRVPTPTGSIVDLTVELGRNVSKEEINDIVKKYAEGEMQGIIQYEDAPIVSSDIIHNAHSSIFDSLLTMVMGNNNDLVKVVSWYDNEWGYSNRTADLAKKMMKAL